MTDIEMPGADPISEAALLLRFPRIGQSRLRTLAQQGKVRFIRGQRGSRWYGPAEIASLFEFLKSPVVPVGTSPSNLGVSGSRSRRAAARPGISGLTSELKEAAVLLLAAKI